MHKGHSKLCRGAVTDYETVLLGPVCTPMFAPAADSDPNKTLRQ